MENIFETVFRFYIGFSLALMVVSAIRLEIIDRIYMLELELDNKSYNDNGTKTKIIRWFKTNTGIFYVLAFTPIINIVVCITYILCRFERYHHFNRTNAFIKACRNAFLDSKLK